MSGWAPKAKGTGLKVPGRGPRPIARTVEDRDSDIDVLQRRVGARGDSATTIDDLSNAGLITQATDGTLVASKTVIDGPQNLYNYLKDYKK